MRLGTTASALAEAVSTAAILVKQRPRAEEVTQSLSSMNSKVVASLCITAFIVAGVAILASAVVRNGSHMGLAVSPVRRSWSIRVAIGSSLVLPRLLIVRWRVLRLLVLRLIVVRLVLRLTGVGQLLVGATADNRNRRWGLMNARPESLCRSDARCGSLLISTRRRSLCSSDARCGG